MKMKEQIMMMVMMTMNGKDDYKYKLFYKGDS